MTTEYDLRFIKNGIYILKMEFSNGTKIAKKLIKIQNCLLDVLIDLIKFWLKQQVSEAYIFQAIRI